MNDTYRSICIEFLRHPETSAQVMRARIIALLQEGEPSFTVTSRRNKLTVRAYKNGRVVSMTTRALARFQSFPDNYILPERKSLACKVIGNAVPPLLAKAILESVT